MRRGFFTAPNCITALRMTGTLCLLPVRPFTPLFFAIYTLAGLTDVLDGWAARRLGCASLLGARLDSVADLLFYGVMLGKIFPALWVKLSWQLWCGVVFVLALRLSSYLVAAVKFRRFASLHTYMNKVTGAAVFTIPYAVLLPAFVPWCRIICAVAAIASAEELAIHLGSQAYNADARSLYVILKGRGNL